MDERQRLVLEQVARLYEAFQRSRDSGDRTLVAFRALQGFFGASTIVNPAFPPDSAEQEHFLVPVPLWALQHLLNAFEAYRRAPTGRSFGEVLGIEGGGQGRPPAKNRMLAQSAQLMLARMVYAHRTDLRATGRLKEARLLNVFADVSIETGYSEDAVRAAWKKWRRVVERVPELQRVVTS